MSEQEKVHLNRELDGKQRFTVGELIKSLEGMPADAPIVITASSVPNLIGGYDLGSVKHLNLSPIGDTDNPGAVLITPDLKSMVEIRATPPPPAEPAEPAAPVKRGGETPDYEIEGQ